MPLLAGRALPDARSAPVCPPIALFRHFYLTTYTPQQACPPLNPSPPALLQCEADPETLAYSQKFLAKIRDDVLVKEGVSHGGEEGEIGDKVLRCRGFHLQYG